MDKLLDFFAPTNYKLALEINRSEVTIHGQVLITGVPTSETVKFHAVDLEIERARLTGTDQDNFDYKNGVLELPIDIDLIGQSVTFEITYHTNLNQNMQACYLSTYRHKGKEERIAATQFESHYARECFPCIDEPAAKATFDLTLIIPDFEPGDVVLANTPLAEEIAGADSSANDDEQLQALSDFINPHAGETRRVFTFETTPRMSTYLLAWVIGKFHKVETVNKNGVKIASYATLAQPKSALKFANETAARALEYYDQRFGIKYPLSKLDQVALPDFEAGAMENWGLVTYRESMMLADQNAAIQTRQGVAITVTHELSHQWFGDLVTMNWWDDLWLNESFASVMEYCCTDALYPEFEIWQGFYTGDCVAALRRDALEGVQAVKQKVESPAEIATLFDGAIVYAKGARLVLMLMRLLGEDKFDQGVRDYFEKYQYQNTVGDDFWQTLQPYADFDVKDFMHAWISQPGYPEIRDGKQHRFLLSGETDDTTWPLPEIFDDMSGHYLLNLTDSEFATKLEEFKELSDEQKLRLLIERELLARTPAVKSASLINLLEKFRTEDSAPVWDTLLAIIGDLKLFCPPETKQYRNYQQFLLQTFGERMAEINYGQLSDLSAIKLRDALIGIAVYGEDETVLRRLREQYNSNLVQIDAELRYMVLVAMLKHDEQKYFAEFLNTYQGTHDPELKSDLLCIIAANAREASSIKTLLGLLERTEIVRPQDHIFLFVYLMRNYKAREQALDWLTQNWDYVKRLTGEKSIEDYVRYSAALVRTPAEVAKFWNFFTPLKSDPVLARALELAKVEIDGRMRLIADDEAEVAKVLATKVLRKSRAS